MKAILFVALGGMIGAVLRYLGSLGAIRLLGDGFAYGTLVVNVIGCIGIGFLAGWGFTTWTENEHVRLFVVTGLLGSLTTFSTFGWETVQFLQEGRWQLALANVALNLAVGLIAVSGGFGVGHSIMGKGV